MSAINHADVYGWLKSQPTVSAAEAAEIVRLHGAAGQLALDTVKPTYLDETKLDKSLKASGKAGGDFTFAEYEDYVSRGHSDADLREAVEEAKGLKLDQPLIDFLRTGITPQMKADAAAAQQRVIDAQNAATDATNTQTQAIIDAADARAAQLNDQFKINQAAAAERERAQQEANRMNMLRSRSGARVANLQIAGAPKDKKAAGSAGFRRRDDQFKTRPKFGSLSINPVALGASALKSMVNI
jgi:SpoVK/Ycf46/Vps4 family AAA+-type ATPase